MSMLYLKNHNQEITETNYWDTDQARKGILYLSWNGGAARLLVPEAMRSELAEMRTAQYVVLSQGPWRAAGEEMLELMFEDDSDTPYAIHISARQSDRSVLEDKREFVFAVWMRAGLQFALPGKYRKVASIPCRAKWEDQ